MLTGGQRLLRCVSLPSSTRYFATKRAPQPKKPTSTVVKPKKRQRVKGVIEAKDKWAYLKRLPKGIHKHQFRYLFGEQDLKDTGVLGEDLARRPYFRGSKKDNKFLRDEAHPNDIIPLECRITTAFPRPLAEPAPNPEKLIRRALNWSTASEAEKRKQRTQNVIELWGRRRGDTGSPEVQIAVMTERIRSMNRQLQENHKDVNARVRLNALIQKRRKYLRYLRKKQFERYAKILSWCGLRDVDDPAHRIGGFGYYNQYHRGHQNKKLPGQVGRKEFFNKPRFKGDSIFTSGADDITEL